MTAMTALSIFIPMALGLLICGIALIFFPTQPRSLR